MSIPTGMVRQAAAEGERLSRRHWQRAALETLTEGGIAAVTVPRIAKKLGVTKGSFYWHFKSVDELLGAALADWERIFTDERLAAFSTVSDPTKRLEPWFAEVERGHPAQKLHLAIAGAADHPVVGTVFARVATKRIAFIAAALRQMGFARKDADARAIAAHAAYLGFLRLLHHAPDSVGAGRTRARNVRIMFAVLTKIPSSEER
jgi:AcrR family transcriptional regulator